MRSKLDQGWLFWLGDPQDAMLPDYEDRAWRALNLPHDWSIEGEYDRDCDTTKRSAFLPAGIGWYRKHMVIDSLSPGTRTSVVFDGIYNNATIYLNGVQLEKDFPNGYLSQEYDLTPYLKQGENVLAVRVDNHRNPSSRWYPGSGIYRHVWLDQSRGAHIDPLDTAATVDWSDPSAPVIHLTYAVSRLSAEPVEIHVSVYAPDQTEIYCRIHPMSDTETETATDNIAVSSPVLWDIGKGDLYRIALSVYTNGARGDSYAFHTGLRRFEYKSDTGLWINGRREKVRGFCVHHDAGPLGAAVPAVVWEKRIQQLMEMGCNAIRVGHKPMAPEFYELCDRMGMLVMDEIYDGWKKKAPYDYGALHYDTRWKTDVEHWIRSNRNHPCIFMWSIGNETGRADRNGMTSFIHQFDARPVTGGEIYDGVDVAGFNGKYEWPGAEMEKMRIGSPDNQIDRYKAENPDRPIILTEYPHPLSTRGFYRTTAMYREYQTLDIRCKDLCETEVFDDYAPGCGALAVYHSSYDNHCGRVCARDSWRFVRDRDWIMGYFPWTGYDYLGESYGWPMRFGNHGVFDLINIPKDIYYFYKSEWTGEPVVHILPHWSWRHIHAQGRKIPVFVYTNCERVELFRNGVSLGVQKRGDRTNLEWMVEYEPGVLKAVGTRGGVTYCDEVCTAGAASKIHLKTDRIGLTSDSDDIAQVTLSVQDKDGTLVPFADDRIFFTVEGPAVVRCADNGDPADMEPHRKDNRRAFNGICKAFVEAYAETGGILFAAAAFLGDVHFESRAHVFVDVAQIVLRSGIEPVAAGQIKIFYTCDGTPATPLSTPYTGPFTLYENAHLHGLAILGDRFSLRFDQKFEKGPRRDADAWRKLPLSRKVIGQWTDRETGEIYDFKSDGTLDLLDKNNVLSERHNWWFDSFDDYYADCTGEPADPNKLCGEINYVWWYAKIAMPNQNTLILHERNGLKTLHKK